MVNAKLMMLMASFVRRKCVCQIRFRVSHTRVAKISCTRGEAFDAFAVDSSLDCPARTNWPGLMAV